MAPGRRAGLAPAAASLLLAAGAAPSTPRPSTGADRVRLSNGVLMPLVSAGTWQYNDSVASAAVQAALSAGFAHVDTAFDYGNQRGVGRGLLASGVERSQVFLTTKVPGCGAQGLGRGDCRANTLRLIEEDIAQLSSAGFPAKYLDLILLHFPPCVAEARPDVSPSQSSCARKRNGCTDPENCAAIGQQWRAVQQAYERGLVRAVGVSNYCRACFDCLGAGGVRPMVNQVQLHVGMGPDPQGFLSFAREQGVVLQAWSPLGHGGGGSPQILNGSLTTSIGRAHGKSAAQVALKWIISRGAAVSTKSSNPKHLAENLDLFSWELSEKELAALDEANFARADTPSFLCDDVAGAANRIVV